MKRPGVQYTEGESIRPSNLRKDQVEQYAAQVGDAFKFEVGTDPRQIVVQLRGRIIQQDLDEWLKDDVSGSIYVHAQFDFDILISSYTSPLRDRFTIAHELGHYFLHSRQGQIPLIAFRQGTGRIEWEANWFAAALLMPADRFKAECKIDGDPLRLAGVFGVSREAAETRKKICDA